MQIIRLLSVVLLLCLALGETAPAQVTWSNGVLGFNLTNAGRIRTGLTPYTSGTRELDRLTIVVAQTPTMVFDYNNDQDSSGLQLAGRITVAGADTAFEALTDNGYSNTPPKIKVRVAVMTWKNSRYLIARYRVINDTTISMPLSVGAIVLPYAGSAYGGETIKYHAASSTGYYYKGAKYWGLRLLGKTPTSFRTLDWNDWSTDPNSEVTSDSLRYAFTTGTGFDSLSLASPDGSVMQLNAGQVTIAAGDSATFYYAFVYGTTLPEMVASVDSAVARFNATFTSVRPVASSIPEAFQLQQNYPNPFNPATVIDFQISQAAQARLSVYDLLGREVAVLVNEGLTPGTYRVTFDGQAVASGTYYYRLVAGSFAETRRMMLIK